MNNIIFTVESILGKNTHCFLFNEHYDHADNINNVTEITVLQFINGLQEFRVNFKAPKNKTKLTVDYIINTVNKKLNKQNCFKNFSDIFAKILLKAGIKNNICSVYSTSYGIGVSVFMANINRLPDIKNILDCTLQKYNIEYRNEYSDARWVFRYKISTSQENINKLKQIEESENEK